MALLGFFFAIFEFDNLSISKTSGNQINDLAVSNSYFFVLCSRLDRPKTERDISDQFNNFNIEKITDQYKGVIAMNSITILIPISC